MKMNKIKVKTQAKEYSIIIGDKLLNNISKIIKSEKILFSKCLIIIDKNIPKHYQKKIIKNLNCNFKASYIFNPSEKNKSQKSIDKIQNILFNKRFNRDDCLIAFGGGIVGDVSAYAASTYKRGMKFINIPTTLLSQVDSSIGGKTGINNKFGKNLIGSFFQPDLVISDIEILKSLPKREIVCGYAEILKSSLLDNQRNFDFLNKNFFNILKLEKKSLKKAIINSCLLKRKIVQKDEKESNLRKVLNLGHTFAHAYESSLNFSKKLNHGEAVVFGIQNALSLSKNLKILSNEKFEIISNHIKKIPIHNSYNNLFNKKHIKKIIYFMKSDKKNISDNINLILMRDFGKIITNYQINNTNLNKFLNSQLN